MDNYQKFYHSNKSSFTAYHKIIGKENNKKGLVFLGGFKSDMNGTKASFLKKYAEENNYDLIRFDYSGHGNSSGDFADNSINSWLEDTLRVIDELTDKPQILIGSSMGGWLMLLVALLRPTKIVELIGLAAAPDFTEELIWDHLTIKQKEDLIQNGSINFSNEFCDEPYLISKKLIEESRQHLLLDKEIPLDIPIHLIHGMEDKDVPYETSIRIAKAVRGDKVKIHLIKDAGHNLSREQDLDFISKVIFSTLEESLH